MSSLKLISRITLVAILIAITVGYALGQATHVRVETAATGSDTAKSQFVGVGRTLTVYANARGGFGDTTFMGNVAATWVLQNITGGVVAGDLVPSVDGKNAAFTGHALGSATIRASSGGLAEIPSGTITVVTPTPVFINPSSRNAAPGVNFTVTVDISDAVNIRAFHVVLSFNKSVIRYVGNQQGSFLSSNPAGFTPFYAATPNADTSGLTVDAAILGAGPGSSVSGGGTLFSMTFVPVTVGTGSVSLDIVDIRDSDLKSYPTAMTGGTANVSVPTEVFVDRLYNSADAGGHEWQYDAHDSLVNGLRAVSIGGTINVAPQTFNVTFNVNKNVTLTPMSGTPIIQNLTVNTPAVTLGGTFRVNGSLTFTSGYIFLGANNFTLGNTGSISGASSSKFIVTDGTGKFVRLGVGTTPAAFPIGSSTTSYNPVSINTGTGTDSFSARVIGSVSPSTVNDETAVKRTWDLSEGVVGGNGILRFTIQWNTAHEGTLFNHVSAVPFRNVGGVWVQDGALVGVISGSDPWSATIDASGLSSWTLGNGENGLPIQLASFTGNVVGNGDVALTWVTLSEVNNYGFYVQRRRPAEQQYAEIPNSFIAGHGTTNEPHTYTFTDVAPGSGSWVYRLRQVDLDNSIHYSEPIQIDVVTGVPERAPMEFVLNQNYPNPFNPSTEIKFSVEQSGLTSLRVYNILGQEVATLFNDIAEAGQYYKVKLDASNFSSGMYFYQLESGQKNDLKKMLLVK